MARAKKSRISVLNWMGTLLLLSIPGINILALLLTLFFAKSPSKRTFAGAIIIWTIILVAAVAAAFIAFPEQISLFADSLEQLAAEM